MTKDRGAEAAAEELVTIPTLDQAGYARVHDALAYQISADDLDADEARVFMGLWGNYMAGPNPERDAFVAKMYAEGGYVGDDEQGRLVRTLPGGGIEVIEENQDK
jgi:hypothetical protein